MEETEVESTPKAPHSRTNDGAVWNRTPSDASLSGAGAPPPPGHTQPHKYSPITALLIAAALMELGYLLIHVAGSDATQMALVLSAYVVGGISFLWLVLKITNIRSSPPTGRATAVAIGAAIVFRLTLLPLAPASSSDVFRYRWEGLVQAAGFNPYTTPPDDLRLARMAQERSDVHSNINHPSVPAIYPPVAQLLFWLNAVVFSGSLLGWKFILLTFDAILAAVGWSLLRACARPPYLLCIVLWCPLLLLETYEGAHLDLIGATFVTAGLLENERGRPILAGIPLGLALNVKYLWPGLALILVILRPGSRRSRITTLITATLVAGLCWIPYLPGLPAAVATLRMFVETWRFNGVIFTLLEMMPGPPWLPAAVGTVAMFSLAVVLARRPAGAPWSDVSLTFGVALMLAPAAFPWYFIWLVPFLLPRPATWLLVWISTVPFLHVVDWRHLATGTWRPMPLLSIIVGLIPALLLAKACWRRLARTEFLDGPAMRYTDRDRQPTVAR